MTHVDTDCLTRAVERSRTHNILFVGGPRQLKHLTVGEWGYTYEQDVTATSVTDMEPRIVTMAYDGEEYYAHCTCKAFDPDYGDARYPCLHVGLVVDREMPVDVDTRLTLLNENQYTEYIEKGILP